LIILLTVTVKIIITYKGGHKGGGYNAEEINCGKHGTRGGGKFRDNRKYRGTMEQEDLKCSVPSFDGGYRGKARLKGNEREVTKKGSDGEKIKNRKEKGKEKKGKEKSQQSDS